MHLVVPRRVSASPDWIEGRLTTEAEPHVGPTRVERRLTRELSAQRSTD